MTDDLLAWFKMNGATMTDFEVTFEFHGDSINIKSNDLNFTDTITHKNDTVTINFSNLMYIPLITDIKEIQ